MNSERFNSKVSKYTLAALLAGSILLIGGEAFANNGSFREFKAMNPGIDKGTLRQIWNGSTGGDGIGFGVVPAQGSVSPRIVAPPGPQDPVTRGSIVPDNFRDFKEMNPGIDNGTLRQIFNGGRPAPAGTIGIGLINAPPSTLVDTSTQITLAEFKELNPGLDRKTVKQMYRHLKSGDGGITIGIIPTSGRFSNPHTDPAITSLNSFGTLNLSSGK